MGAKAQRLRIRLFLEGVEVPVIAAQVQVRPNSPMVASIQIPPLAEATRFLPRTLVHLYFLDFYEAENLNLTKTGTSIPKAPGPTVYEQAAERDVLNDVVTNESNEFVKDVQNQQYKLLFCGELMGFAWSKNQANRSIILQCSDMSNYWDYAYQYNNTDLFGPGYKALFSGGSTNLFTDFLSDAGSIVTQILHQPPTRYPDMKGLLGGVIHLLEAMGGSYYYDKKYAGQNIFFSLAELRLHLTQMLTAFEKDPTSHRLLGGSFDSLFGRSIGNLGEQASFRKVISMLTSVIFHEVYPQPCPLYVPGKDGTISGFVRKKVSSIPGFSSLATAADGLIESLEVTIKALNEYTLSEKPTDETELSKFRSAYRADMLQRMALAQTQCQTSARQADQAKPRGANAIKSLVQVADQISRHFRTAATSIGQALSKLKATQGLGTGSTVTKLLRDASSELKKILSLEANVTPPKQAIPGQLKQQIFRPDVWFSAPPRCNVLFPDQYTQLNYSRQFMQEPTRLLLKTNDEFFGEDELFDNFYFAPKAVTLKSERNTLQAILRGDILDHELFTGILPVFEKMGEFNIFAARSGMVNGKTPKIGLAQRSTNFLYFKYRFASRQLQVTGRFNPYIACGFPGLIIDKYVDLQTFKLHSELTKTLPNEAGIPPRALNSMLGTHFLGNFTEVTHAIDQGQGTTLINCSYARQPEESVEFLGAVEEEVILRRQGGKPATRTTTVAALTPPRVNSQGPNFGRITEVLEVTSRYSYTDISSKLLPVFHGNRDPKTKQLTTLVPVGFADTAKNLGPDIPDLVGDENLVVRFLAYDITEEISREKKEYVELPPEEYIRPGWYGDCWHPAKIAEVYYDFFNTGSITEPTSVQNTDGSDFDGLVTSDAQTTLADMQNAEHPMSYARDQLVQLSLTKEANIEAAVAFLVLSYSVVKQANFDSEQFIRSYTWRPIASMLDMFGSADLELDVEGKEVVRGIEGFHSRAFGPFNDLFGLVTNDIESIVGIKKGSAQAQKADTRKRKYEKVLEYVSAIRLSRAILG